MIIKSTKVILFLLLLLMFFSLVACNTKNSTSEEVEEDFIPEENAEGNVEETQEEREEIEEREEEKEELIECDLNKTSNEKVISKEVVMEVLGQRKAKEWGENLAGVKTTIDTNEKVVALTFDACGGKPGEAYDEALIEHLREERIPATLFFTGSWIKNHEEIFMELAEDPLFEVGNHGYLHKPLSINGKKAYGIEGTKSLAEAYNEVVMNQELIFQLTGKYPKYFRSGTAYYDDVAVELLELLNLIPINYSVLGDAGATFTKDQIVRSMESADPGAIMLFHMNHPNSEVYEGVKEGLKRLKDKGFRFVKVGDYEEALH